MKRTLGMIAGPMVAALQCERGFLGSVGTIAEGAGSVIGSIGGLFGGGGPDAGSTGTVTVDGITVHNNNPIGVSEWRQAWANAPSSVKANAWQQVLSQSRPGHGEFVRNMGQNAGDSLRGTLILWGANGGSNGEHDSFDNHALQVARGVMSGSGGAQGISVESAPHPTTTTPTTGDRIDQIIAAIEGRPEQEVTPTGAAGQPTQAGVGSSPVMLALLGAGAFLLLRS